MCHRDRPELRGIILREEELRGFSGTLVIRADDDQLAVYGQNCVEYFVGVARVERIKHIERFFTVGFADEDLMLGGDFVLAL